MKTNYSQEKIKNSVKNSKNMSQTMDGEMRTVYTVNLIKSLFEIPRILLNMTDIWKSLEGITAETLWL